MEKAESERWAGNYFGCGAPHAGEVLHLVPARKSEFTGKTDHCSKPVGNYFGCGLDDREGTEDGGK